MFLIHQGSEIFGQHTPVNDRMIYIPILMLKMATLYLQAKTHFLSVRISLFLHLDAMHFSRSPTQRCALL